MFVNLTGIHHEKAKFATFQFRVHHDKAKFATFQFRVHHEKAKFATFQFRVYHALVSNYASEPSERGNHINEGRNEMNE